MWQNGVQCILITAYNAIVWQNGGQYRSKHLMRNVQENATCTIVYTTPCFVFWALGARAPGKSKATRKDLLCCNFITLSNLTISMLTFTCVVIGVVDCPLLFFEIGLQLSELRSCQPPPRRPTTPVPCQYEPSSRSSGRQLNLGPMAVTITCSLSRSCIPV